MSGNSAYPGNGLPSSIASLQFGSQNVPLSTTTQFPDGTILENVNGTAQGVPVDTTVNGRATLTSGVPVTVSDVTSALGGYFTPFLGNRVVLYDGTRNIPVTFSEIAWLITDSSQTGGTITGTTITGLTDTSKLFVGMKLSASTGTGTLAGSTTIATVVSATSITVNNAASVNGTLTNLVFKMPANSNLSWYGVYSSGSMVLRPGTLWANQNAEADTVALVNGRKMNTSVVRSTQSNAIPANQGLLLFTVATNSNDGQTDDAGGSGATPASRLLLNYYNARPRNVQCVPGYVNDNANTSWVVSSASWGIANPGASGAGATFKFLSSTEYAANFTCTFLAITSTNAQDPGIGIGIDSTSNPSVTAFNYASSANSANGGACEFSGTLSLGIHSISMLAVVFNWVTPTTGTFYSDTARAGATADPIATCIQGTVWT